MDLKLLQNIMEEVRENKDLLDSFSPNQFKSKLKLINHIKDLNILNKNSEIVIFGSWFVLRNIIIISNNISVNSAH